MTARDRLLELIGETCELLDVSEFRQRLLHALPRALPCDWVALSDSGPDPFTDVELVEPPVDPELLRIFAELVHQNPLRVRIERTGDGRAYRFSDVTTREQFHELELYQRFYRLVGVEHQMACTLPSVRNRILAIVLSRRHEDFSDAERDLLNEARPFLIQAYRNAISYDEAQSGAAAERGARAPRLDALITLGLTRRQAEVLQLLATGASDREIAKRLEISHRTVHKHLEHCYAQLGVGSRSEASAIAWAS